MRQSRRSNEWSNFQQYCLYGRLPPEAETICQWQGHFPKNQLFTATVMHALAMCSGAVNTVRCEGEADRVVASAATGRPDHYVLGSDSDYCFFPGLNYVPLQSLGAGGRKSTVTATVLRRRDVADSLDLPDEGALVELAILLGNDYIDPATAQLDEWHCCKSINKKTDKILDFVRSRGKGYRVTSVSEDTEEALRFIRMLYNLESLNEFPFASPDGGDEEEEAPQSSTLRPSIPKGIDMSLAQVRPLIDGSVKDAVLRCLEAFLDQHGEGSFMTHEHLDAYRQLNLDGVDDPKLSDSSWRPLWEDVPAVSLLEKVLAKVTTKSLSSPLVRLCPPFAVFDSYKYHRLLQATRTTRAKDLLSSAVAPRSAPADYLIEGESTKFMADEQIHVDDPAQERVSLPVDEYEHIILESVKQHRVTIIQGETGCGKSSRIRA
jgi:hypothetical protein